MIFSIFDIFLPRYMYLLIPIFVVLMILLLSSFYDLKLCIVPNFLSKLLIVFGIIFNVSIAVIYSNYYFLLNSLIITVIIFVISLILWKIKFWGGGDLKIFTGMAFTLSYFSSPLFTSLNILPYMEQNFFYFPILSILFNAILISFPFLIIWLLINYINENYNEIKELFIKDYDSSNQFALKFKIYLNLLEFFIFNFKKILYMSSKKSIKVSDLEEGMILDNYLFAIEDEFKFIMDLFSFTLGDKFDFDDLNLDYGVVKVSVIDSTNTDLDIKELLKNKSLIKNQLLDEAVKKEKNNLKFIASDNGMGLTETDIILINYLYEKEYFKNPEFIVKRSIPFIPSLTIGYLIFLLFGDLITIISSFLSSLF